MAKKKAPAGEPSSNQHGVDTDHRATSYAEAVTDQLKQRASQSSDALQPLEIARLVRSRFDGLLHWQQQFFRWRYGAYDLLPDDSVRARIYEEIEKLGAKANRASVNDALDALRSVAHWEDLDPPCWIKTKKAAETNLLAVKNGLLDMKTDVLMEPTTDYFTLSALPVNYDAKAPATHWQNFLASMWPDDTDSINALQEVFGYMVSGDTSQQKIIMLVGPRRSGKGTILRVLTALLGRNNVAAPTLSSLATPFGLQPLIGKLAGLISDARLGRRADQDQITERLLSISGEDWVNIPRKFLPDFTAQLQTRFVLASNELPKLQDSSGALPSRFLILTLSRSWLGNEDRHLTRRLLKELPGILLWALEGYRRLEDRGAFRLPESAAESMQMLEDLSSPIGTFVRDCCVTGNDCQVEKDAVWQEWRDWCEDHGRGHPGTKETFGRDLRAAVPGLKVVQPRRQNGERVRVYSGLALADARWREQTAPVKVTITEACQGTHLSPGVVLARLSETDIDDIERGNMTVEQLHAYVVRMPAE